MPCDTFLRLLAVAEPCQFQQMTAVTVFVIDDDERAVLGVDPPDLFHIESVGVEFETFFKGEHVEVIMDHSEFHLQGSLVILSAI